MAQDSKQSVIDKICRCLYSMNQRQAADRLKVHDPSLALNWITETGNFWLEVLQHYPAASNLQRERSFAAGRAAIEARIDELQTWSRALS